MDQNENNVSSPGQDALADQYDRAVAQGRSYIQRSWGILDEKTRSLLVATGAYSERGGRQDVELPTRVPADQNIESLEYTIGVLHQCVSAPSPGRKTSSADYPAEALTDDVLNKAGALLLVPAWCDPAFLRLALSAVVHHKVANMAMLAGPAESGPPVAVKVLSLIISAAVALAGPLFLAMALDAVVRQDPLSSMLWFYGLSASIVGVYSLRKSALELVRGATAQVGPQDWASAYSAWSLLQFESGGFAGPGAIEKLRSMAARGIHVPTVAFGLAHALRQSLHSRS